MIGIWVVDAFCTIDRSAGCAAWRITITLVSSSCQRNAGLFISLLQPRSLWVFWNTFDFLLRHAMHAVLTHRLLADAADSLSLLRGFALMGFGLIWVEPLVLFVTGMMLCSASSTKVSSAIGWTGPRSGLVLVPRRCYEQIPKYFLVCVKA